MIKRIASSPARNTFQAESSKRKLEKDPNDEGAKQMLDWYEQIKLDEADRIHDPEWQKNNMEYDLRSTGWILEKVKEDRYAQNLYAAMCNRDFVKNDVWPLLKEETWSCSWRHAGGIIADMREEGDYIDWYCSGIQQSPIEEQEFQDLTEDEKVRYLETKAYVPEGVVTDEIREDLLRLGWVVVIDNELDV
jgi:hypothetical protein